MPFDCTNANITAYNLTCSSDASYSKFKFAKGKTHRLRLINAGSQGTQRFAIDGLKMMVISNDFIPIVPYETDMVTLGIGQRADVLVRAPRNARGPIWMRSVSRKCSVSTQGFARPIIYFRGEDTSSLPNSTATVYNDEDCGDVPLYLTLPLFPMAPPSVPAMTKQLDISFPANVSGTLLWYVNNQTFKADYEHPLLFPSTNTTTSPSPNPSIPIPSSSNKTTRSIRLILNNYSSTPRSQHPMHLHGHNFYIVAQGTGTWNGIANLKNPMRRDTYILRPGDPKVGLGYVVMDFEADNVGVWALHCHLAWHVGAGLNTDILERPEEYAGLEIPSNLVQTCRDWGSYDGVDLVPEIDSGL